MSTYEYVGAELDLFSAAKNWKGYLRREIQPYLVGDVLEVGAGIGTTTRALHLETVNTWVCLEPDPLMAARLRAAVESCDLPAQCEVQTGTIDQVKSRRFDTVLYVDVLEHISDDMAEVQRASAHLRSGGHLVVLSPAHQWLFTPFDSAIGHFRRYDKPTIRALTPPGLVIERLVYLDAVGLLASITNRLVLHSEMPTPGQIRFWDRWMVPLSKHLDSTVGYQVGKSILAVWKRIDTHALQDSSAVA